jgi:hypothetical protein
MPIIARVLEENKGRTDKEIREALRLAYPFGQKLYYPYKIWLDEIRRQMTGGRTSVSKPRYRDGPILPRMRRMEAKLAEHERIYGRRAS